MTRPLAVDATDAAEAVGHHGPRIAVTLGMLAVLDHLDENERLHRLGLFVRQVLAAAEGVAEVQGARSVVWAGRRLAVLTGSGERGPSIIIASAWELAFTDPAAGFAIMAPRTVAPRFLQ